VVHACNPSYSGGKDQEDRGLKSTSLQDSYLEKTHHKKRAGGVAQGVGPEFKAQYWKKKRKKDTRIQFLYRTYLYVLYQARWAGSMYISKFSYSGGRDMKSSQFQVVSLGKK
jgi:hypothetical protein